MLNVDEILKSFVEIRLKQPDDFLKIKETLTRIGIASNKNGKTLYQSVHILHKHSKYYLCHFKQMFMLDGKQSDFSESDRARLNTIAGMIEKWGLADIVRPEQIAEPTMSVSQIKILPFSEKKDWKLVEKYRIGIPKRNNYANRTFSS